MQVDTLFQIAGLCMVNSVLGIVLRNIGREDQAQMLSLIVMVFVLFTFIKVVRDIFTVLKWFVI